MMYPKVSSMAVGNPHRRIHGCRPIGDVPNTEEFPLPAARWPGYNCRTGLPAKQRFGSASHQILKQARASFDRTFCWNSQQLMFCWNLIEINSVIEFLLGSLTAF
jgi:hypothetical protein